ncbi:MAG: uridine kinase, partial [Candidatus Rokuibacteriota bacterium]
LGAERVGVLAHDAYYRDRSELDDVRRAALDFDAPDAFDQERFHADLAALRRGEPVVPPRYCFVTHRRLAGAARVEPRETVLVEGLLLFHDPAVRAVFDLRVWVDAPDDLRLTRRIERDAAERGRPRESVIAQFRASVFPAHTRWVEPTKAWADLILVNAGRLDTLVEVAAGVIRARLGHGRGVPGAAQAA